MTSNDIITISDRNVIESIEGALERLERDFPRLDADFPKSYLEVIETLKHKLNLLKENKIPGFDTKILLKHMELFISEFRKNIEFHYINPDNLY